MDELYWVENQQQHEEIKKRYTFQVNIWTRDMNKANFRRNKTILSARQNMHTNTELHTRISYVARIRLKPDVPVSDTAG
jgi:hypothetical protein